MKTAYKVLTDKHFWIITILTALIGIGYYGELVGIDSWAPIGKSFFSSDYTHDVHRALLLIPLCYAAAVFRLTGALVLIAIVFAIVLPRGLAQSELPDPLFRSIITTVIISMVAVLFAMERERSQRINQEMTMRKKSEEGRLQLANIVESSEDAIIGKSLDGIIAAWNNGAEKLYGYLAEEVIGRPVSLLIPHGHEDDLEVILTKIRLNEEVKRYETIRMKKNGSLVDVALTISPIKNQDGIITGASTIARDITERKRDENRIQHLNAVLRAIRDVEELIVHEKDRGSLIHGICDSLIRTRGYHNAWIALLDNNHSLEMAAEAGLGESFLPMLNELKMGRLTACEEKALKRSEVIVTDDPLSTCYDCPLSAEYSGRGAMTIRLEHGGNVYGLLSVSIPGELLEESQEQELFRAVASDIAFALHDMDLEEASNQAKESLRIEREQLLSIFSGIDEVVYVADPHTYETLYMNEKAKLQWGDGVGQKCYRILQNLDAPCPFCTNELIFDDNIGNSHIWEFRNNVNHRWYRCIDKAIYWPDERMVRMEIAIDITAFKEAEEQIRELNAELEQRVVERTAELTASNKELEAFSYSVSHDLRSPLRSIDGFSQALLEDYEGKIEDEGKDFLHRIRAASQRMGFLIDDLLGLSRVTRKEMHRETVTLSEMVKDIAVQLQQREPDRKVEFDIGEGLEATGDIQLLQIALRNLMENAWKFSSRNPDAKIEFGLIDNDKQRTFFVRDNGAGFDMTYSGKLFGAFQRLHTASEFDGTGIGLATVQRIIRRHGGQVWAEGEVGKGATFYFTL